MSFGLWFSEKSFDLSVIGKPYRSYVALGDSLSEGLGDFTFHLNRHENGWPDRLAGILAREADDGGHDFHYANLAIRGAKLEKVMGTQLPKALALQPDLVTLMAGSNDLIGRNEDLPRLKSVLREGVQTLVAAGCDVVLANTINPIHLRVFKPLRRRAHEFSLMVEEIAGEFELPVLDIYGIEDFEQLIYWAEDMVHFSGHGHITVANRAARILDLRYRYPELDPIELTSISRGLVDTARWVVRDVLPFFERKLKGVTSGDGLDPKHSTLAPYRPSYQAPHWQLISR